MATRANEDDTNENGDAPLIDLNDATVKKLLAKAKRRGFLTYDELNAALPQDQMSTDQIEDIMSQISEMGVNIVESDEDGEEKEDAEEIVSFEMDLLPFLLFHVGKIMDEKNHWPAQPHQQAQ